MVDPFNLFLVICSASFNPKLLSSLKLSHSGSTEVRLVYQIIAQRGFEGKGSCTPVVKVYSVREIAFT